MSAVMSDQSSNNVAEFFSPGPGERLRAARLSMGYDLGKLASELHLTSAVVEALEADDYSDIGARVFVRGYFRNYARIVGMPVESIMRQFDEKWPDDGARQSMVRESPTLPADGGPSRGLAGAMTWLLVIGIVVLFLMWWRGYLDEIVPEQIRTSGSAETERPSEQDLYREDAAPGADRGQVDDGLFLPVPADRGSALDPAPAGSPVSGGGETRPAAPAGGGPRDSGITLPVTQSPAPAPVSPAPAAVVAAAEPASAAGSTPGQVQETSAAGDDGAPVVDGTKRIVMTFSAPCWVDVRDSERKFKLFGEIPKGSRKVLGGQPPYKIVIGNSQAVTITVNGEPFDLAPYAKGNVARFTLDP